MIIVALALRLILLDLRVILLALRLILALPFEATESVWIQGCAIMATTNNFRDFSLEMRPSTLLMPFEMDKYVPHKTWSIPVGSFSGRFCWLDKDCIGVTLIGRKT